MSGPLTSGPLAGIAGFHGSGDERLLRSLGRALAHRGTTEDVQLAVTGGMVARGGKVAADGSGMLAAASGADAADALARYLASGLDGLAVLTAVSGACALAVYDAHTATVLLVRDGADAAPLYYTRGVGGVVFASEPAALVAVRAVPLAPDDAVVTRFLLNGVVEDGEATFFAGVRRVPAGHAVVVDDSGVSCRPLVPPPGATDPARAVTDALSGAGRPAVRLSGGLSGAALAAGVPHVEAFAASFGPMDAGEDAYATAVTERLGTGGALRTVPVTADTLAADLPAFLRAQGEPVADLDAYVQYAVARAAVEAGVDVLLDPAGAAVTHGLTPPGPAKKPRKPVDPAALLRPEALAAAGPTAVGRAPAGPPARPVGGAPGVAAALAGPAPARLAAVRRAADRTAAHLGLRVALPYASARGDAESLRLALPPAARAVAAEIRPPAPLRDWLLRLKNRIYGAFLAESFVNRPWFNQQAVLLAFEDFIKGRNADAELFWRIWCVETWAAEFFDAKPVVAAPVPVKGPLEPNAGKQLEIAVEVDGTAERWLRFPIRTDLFTSGDPYVERITGYVREQVRAAAGDERYAKLFADPWYLLVSEKIVAIAQGRSYFIWDIQPSWWARTLSKFVVRTPYGIGLGSPWTMELAIREAGLPRILVAAAVGAAGKLVGRRGWFYMLAGHSVRAIDGPTEYSVYPANVSAKLAPAEPDAVAGRLRQAVRAALAADGLPDVAASLAGVVVIDANDIGRNVLGQDADRPPRFFEELFADNPLGQGSEQTPLAVAVRTR